MEIRFLVATAVLACAPGLVALAQDDTELQRVRDLVRAGALPRNALVEAEGDLLERRYRETLNRTLLSETLEPSEIQVMLDSARALERIAQERFDRVFARVEAGAAPARELQEVRERLKAARRQSELARTRSGLIRQMERMAAAESYREELESAEAAFAVTGLEDWGQELLPEIGDMYRLAFGVDPPISAEGDTALHRSLGLDHSGRIDVAVHPDSDEGMFLIYVLESFGIPYIAFRSAVPSQSTGPHIHVGPPSEPIGSSEP